MVEPREGKPCSLVSNEALSWASTVSRNSFDTLVNFAAGRVSRAFSIMYRRTRDRLIRWGVLVGMRWRYPILSRQKVRSRRPARVFPESAGGGLGLFSPSGSGVGQRSVRRWKHRFQARH